MDLSVCRLVRRGCAHTLHTAARNSLSSGSKHTAVREFAEEPSPSPTALPEEWNTSARLSACHLPKHQIKTQSKKRASQIVLKHNDAGLSPAAPQPRGEGGRARPPAQTRVQGTAAGSILHQLPAACIACLHCHSSQVFCNCNVHWII